MEDQKFESFISGFVAGEGSFYIITTKTRGIDYIYPRFEIKLHISDLNILKKIKEYLRCGTIRLETKNRNYAQFIVHNNKEIHEKIIPFFERNPMGPSKKQESFDRWKIVAIMIKNKEPKEKIKIVSNAINLNGKSHKEKVL